MAKAPRSRAGTTRNTATNPNQISRIHEDTLNLDLNLRAPPLRVPRTTSPNDQRQARRNFTVADPEIQQARRDFRNELESEEYQEDEIQQDEIQPFFDTQVQNSNSNDDDIFTENSSEEEEAEEAEERTTRRERRKKEKKRKEAEERQRQRQTERDIYYKLVT